MTVLIAVADSANAREYRARVSDPETASLWQSLAFGPNYKAAYCISACRSGICGACQMRLKRGDALQSGERMTRAGTAILACVSYPATNELVLDLRTSTT